MEQNKNIEKNILNEEIKIIEKELKNEKKQKKNIISSNAAISKKIGISIPYSAVNKFVRTYIYDLSIKEGLIIQNKKENQEENPNKITKIKSKIRFIDKTVIALSIILDKILSELLENSIISVVSNSGIRLTVQNIITSIISNQNLLSLMNIGREEALNFYNLFIHDQKKTKFEMMLIEKIKENKLIKEGKIEGKTENDITRYTLDYLIDFESVSGNEEIESSKSFKEFITEEFKIREDKQRKKSENNIIEPIKIGADTALSIYKKYLYHYRKGENIVHPKIVINKTVISNILKNLPKYRTELLRFYTKIEKKKKINKENKENKENNENKEIKENNDSIKFDISEAVPPLISYVIQKIIEHIFMIIFISINDTKKKKKSISSEDVITAFNYIQTINEKRKSDNISFFVEKKINHYLANKNKTYEENKKSKLEKIKEVKGQNKQNKFINYKEINKFEDKEDIEKIEEDDDEDEEDIEKIEDEEDDER